MPRFRNRTVTGLKCLRAGKEAKWIKENPKNPSPGDPIGFAEVVNSLIELGISACAK
jgi:hypothetical protein